MSLTRLDTIKAIVRDMPLVELSGFVHTFGISMEIAELVEASKGPAMETTADGNFFLTPQAPQWFVRVYTVQKKLQQIKAIRLITGYGLKETKDFVDGIAGVTGTRLPMGFATYEEAQKAANIIGAEVNDYNSATVEEG